MIEEIAQSKNTEGEVNMIEVFNAATREAIYASGRTFADISQLANVSKETVYRLARNGGKRRLHPYNADCLVSCLDFALRAEIQRHSEAIERLKNVRTSLIDAYVAAYKKEDKDGKQS